MCFRPARGVVSENNFGLGGGTVVKSGRMMKGSGATSMHSSMCVHLSVYLCVRFE